MDQGLVAIIVVAIFAAFGIGYWIGIQEGKSRHEPYEMDGWPQ